MPFAEMSYSFVELQPWEEVSELPFEYCFFSNTNGKTVVKQIEKHHSRGYNQ